MKNEVLEFLTASLPPQVLERIHVAHSPRYDTVAVPSAGTSGPLRFFAVPLGGNDPNGQTNNSKTLEWTNIKSQRELGDVAFLLTSIRMLLFWQPKKRQVSGISTDADGLFDKYKNLTNVFVRYCRSGVLEIKIDEKDSFQINQPFLRCPPGFGPVVTGWATATTQGSFAQQPPAKKPMTLRPFKLIKPNTKVEAELTYPNAASPALTNLYDGSSLTPRLAMRLILDGYEIRGLR